MTRVASGGRRGNEGKKGEGKSGETKLERVMCGTAQTEPRAQVRAVRKDGWTTRRRGRFLDVLRATCNVQEAARAVNMNKGGAYDVRRRDAGFAAQWKEALEEGYAELEMALLRQSIHGYETTETVDDGKDSGALRTRKVHSYPHTIALRLLLAHREAVDAYRSEQGIDRPGSENVRAEIQVRIAAMRSRARPAAADAGGEDAPADESGDGDA